MLAYWTCKAKGHSTEPQECENDRSSYCAKGDPLCIRAYTSRGEYEVVEKMAEH